ncbi:MAG: hypothetical protein CMI53_04495, partial [Parcubacteria group bacterium]|nr:hypothetical protein [Parcubacteria group bacterium]
IDILKSKKNETITALKKKLDKMNSQLENLEIKKKRILDLYADGVLNKESYIQKIGEIDLEFSRLNGIKKELKNKKSLIASRKEVRSSVSDFCKLARRKFDKLDKKAKIQFIKNIIDEIIIFKNNSSKKLIIRGIIPILADNNTTLPQCYTRLWGGFGWRGSLAKTR